MKIIAHRGASGIAPENTLLALATAMAAGSDMVEFDVQLTKDRNVVLFHDRSLSRITGIEEGIAYFTLQELYSLDVGSWKDAKFADIGIPTLSDALTLLNGFHAVVEIKPQYTAIEEGRVLERKTLEILDDSAGIGEGYISVRDIVTLDWFKSQTSKYRIGLMQKKRTPQELFTLIEEHGTNIVQTRSKQFTQEDYRDLSRYDVESYVYWGDSPEEWNFLLRQPISGILTNYPALMRGYMKLHHFTE